jgi:hypothetical protein
LHASRRNGDRAIAANITEQGLNVGGAVIALLPENTDQIGAAVKELLQRSGTKSVDAPLNRDLSESITGKGSEFARRVQRLARRKKIAWQFVGDKGKGRHGRLYFGEEFTPPQGSEERNRPRHPHDL